MLLVHYTIYGQKVNAIWPFVVDLLAILGILLVEVRELRGFTPKPQGPKPQGVGGKSARSQPMSLESRQAEIEQSQRQGQGPGGGGSGPGNSTVEITINGNPYQIRRGRHSVAEIKTLGNVPLTDDLEQVINGQLTLLPDDGHVVIHGQEVFASHPKTGASS